MTEITETVLAMKTEDAKEIARVPIARRKVVREITKKIVGEVTDIDTKSERLQTDYSKIVAEYHPMRDISELNALNNSKKPGAEIPPEIVYLRNLYSALPVADIDWKEIQKFWDGRVDSHHLIVDELRCKLANVVAHYTNEQRRKHDKNDKKSIKLLGGREEALWDLIQLKIQSKPIQLHYWSTNETSAYCLSQMIKTKDGLKTIVTPGAQLGKSISRVKKMFEDLIKPHKYIIKKMEEILKSEDEEEIRKKIDKLKNDNKDKLSPQLFEHIKSEVKDKHSHVPDENILAETDTYKILVNPTKIYIASYDMRFFSPLLKKNWEGKTEVEDDIITQRIQKKFEITCNSPEKILEEIEKNSTDNA